MDREYRVVQIGRDSESIELFERLARAAQAGELTGAIVIAICRPTGEQRYLLSLAGTAANNPTYAAGAMSACQVLVQELALQDAGLV